MANNTLNYEKVKARAREVSALKSLAGREISPLPAVVNPARRVEASRSLLAFCRYYLKSKYKKPFGKNHLRLIDAFERVISHGGKQAVAMPRGTGKTTLAVTAATWALLTGRRRFVVIVAANTKEARKLLKAISTILSSTPALAEDFPEVCYPLQKLRGSALLARGQLFYGAPTNIQISADSLRLPTIRGSVASGATVAAYGVNAAIRGLSTENPDGSTDRPDFLFLDDLQTDAVAINPNRVAQLEETVASTLEGLVENGAEPAMVQTCTVKAPDDYSDRTLNRELYPRWNGLRFQSLESMPKNMDLWREYRAIWFDDEKAATRFYKKNKKTMQEGAVVSWPDAYVGKKLADSLEYYMTRWCENERAFWSEQQNQPLETHTGAIKLAAKDIAAKTNGFERGVVPDDCVKLTAAVDVHSDVLYYSIIAWNASFTGRIVDYGTFPEQKRTYFQKNDGGLETLKRIFPDSTADGRVQRGLDFLFRDLRERAFASENEIGVSSRSKRIDRILVDMGWKPEVVENAIRAVDVRLIIPARGVAVLAKRAPMRQWPKKPGRVFGWRLIDEKTTNSALRSILIDVNYWKTKTHESFSLAPGESGSLSLFGTSRSAHRMFSEHAAAETAKLVEYATNKVVEWSPNINRPDNHYFDTIVYNYAAASSLGLLTSDDPRRGKLARTSGD